MKRFLILLFGIIVTGTLMGCGSAEPDKIEITYYAAKSLNAVSEELIECFGASHPEVVIKGSYDSSGTLMEGILNGHQADVFFSASKTQMDRLVKEGMVAENSVCDLLNNRVCVVTYKGSNTRVTGLENLAEGKSLALADGSVPVGKYTRTALVNAGLVPFTEEVSKLSAEEISKALGNIPVNSCGNVGAVTTAVAEAANEVGTVYYSDLYGRENQLEILEIVPYELTGDVIYPAARVKNPKADEKQVAAAEKFLKFLQSKEAAEIFEAYYFDVLNLK